MTRLDSNRCTVVGAMIDTETHGELHHRSAATRILEHFSQ